ncbi:hypothetical protein EDI_244900 [Entamoeba dispar SAW760]|uniref:Uncharacterized protein n=1 Tax=Entamoeba dispar (strain ATCC PRA-260 / SAW760) TaxID=370354 RepID=B0EGK7_ENTDS|nr:uncharacterized protein EDI_244900 [Entamoeba dispar SAW760]EDR26339.1 hypothetical protein EDI_244900 [Entamoeba dispar SAW760]|eukprot:EDR26339.1 hypothetical protein EDI_244900 [Entamoeba dispar SAW760]
MKHQIESSNRNTNSYNEKKVINIDMNFILSCLIIFIANAETVSFVLDSESFKNGWHIYSDNSNCSVIQKNGMLFFKDNITTGLKFVNENSVSTKDFNTLQFYFFFEGENDTNFTVSLSDDVDNRRKTTGLVEVITFTAQPNVTSKIILPIDIQRIRFMTFKLGEGQTLSNENVRIRDLKFSDEEVFIENDPVERTSSNQLVIFDPIVWQCENGVPNILIMFGVFSIFFMLI